MHTRETQRVHRAFLLVLLLIGWPLGAVPTTVHAQAAFEVPPTLKASAILPAELLTGPDHQVADAVQNDGYMNHYVVTSRFGEFPAVSTAMLRIRVTEVQALAAMEKVTATDEFKQAFQERAGKVVHGFENLVTKPEETLSGAVSGVARTFERSGEALFGSKRSNAEAERWKDAVGFAKTKRDYASHFGVDPYSSNRVLQAALDRISWAGYFGGLSMGAVTMVVPGAAGVAFSVQGATTLMNEVLATTPPTDLRRSNREQLRAMGVEAQLTELFINNAALSPRHQTLLVAALAEMSGVADRAAFIRFAIPTDTEDLAFFRQRMAELYAGYHRNVSPLARFAPVGQFVAAQTRSGALVLAAPLDYLVWTPSAARVADAFAAQAKKRKMRELQLWVGGTMSETSRLELQRQGWTVHELSEEQLLARRP
jgi:hypothetical protein